MCKDGTSGHRDQKLEPLVTLTKSEKVLLFLEQMGLSAFCWSKFQNYVLKYKIHRRVLLI